LVMDRVELLCGILSEESRVCSELTGVLRQEQEAVIRLRPEAILVCLEQRNTLQDNLVKLARERRALVRAMGEEHGRTTTRASDVLSLLPAEPQSRVRGEMRQLRRALLEARGLERQNALLVGSSLDTVSELLRALRSLLPGVRYGARAEVAVPSEADTVDRRA